MANHNKAIKRQMSVREAKFEPVKKALKKNEIIQQLEELQLKYMDLEKKNINLEEENQVHKEAINLLEETVKILEEKATLIKKDKKTTEIQTDISNLEGPSKDVYFCGDCDYLADCIHDFNDHTHSSDDLENPNMSLFNCNFCDESFKNLSDVMKHNKLKHTSSVQHCKQFLENICFMVIIAGFIIVKHLENRSLVLSVIFVTRSSEPTIF